ncbi:unnamed protein product, partial [Cylindrotheca closterium]
MLSTPEPATPSKKKRSKKKRNASTPQVTSEDCQEEATPQLQRDLSDDLEGTLQQPVTRAGSRASTNPQQVQNPPQVAMPARNQANQVTIGGVTITTQATPATDVGGSLVAMKKENRSALDADKKHAFFQLITKHQHT